MPPILVVPVQPYDDDALRALIVPLESIFRFPASIDTAKSIDPSFAFDAYRNQFNSTSLISAFTQRFNGLPGKIIGVTSVDLFVPVLTYVFGEAQLDGQMAVVSTHRLDDRLYGLPANPALLHERLIKEAVHELGHTFGLVHCHDYQCVMHSSTAAEDIDVKSENFCPSCAALLQDRERS
ncbi:MAG TPA: archaemetzincin family Zn-dependent metalloprotease [Bacteroidota bacterium]|nr:archaemetzincin family Zn-dependent metalloprotease [Bacteroidota bacterium]